MIASYYLARWSLIAIIRLLSTICQYSHEKVFRLPDEQFAQLFINVVPRYSEEFAGRAVDR